MKRLNHLKSKFSSLSLSFVKSLLDYSVLTILLNRGEESRQHEDTESGEPGKKPDAEYHHNVCPQLNPCAAIQT
ncbi:hypothetical protein Poly21_57020 [Allorhodopirellula heiligendammensis]|uniref:Uncharacterized protein n=1 Tax=Allorhodopirellula heiligendammensis TaxID=2714739 RepID=A0A5C6AZB9_9BACT|nr:hypothetical protein Poly21_57020 [Allorhodopirellula heiligendammensis]